MQRGQREVSYGGMLIAMLLLINAIILSQGLTSGTQWYGWFFLTIPVLLFVLLDVRRRIRN